MDPPHALTSPQICCDRTSDPPSPPESDRPEETVTAACTCYIKSCNEEQVVKQPGTMWWEETHLFPHHCSPLNYDSIIISGATLKVLNRNLNLILLIFCELSETGACMTKTDTNLALKLCLCSYLVIIYYLVVALSVSCLNPHSLHLGIRWHNTNSLINALLRWHTITPS